jgi:hypothetical protein
MAPYAILLNRNHYATLLDNAALGSEAHIALIGATPPTSGRNYVVICSEKAFEQLTELAERYCQDAVVEISRQFQCQKTRPE